MRFPGFFFGRASLGRDRRSGKSRRRLDATHRLHAESLEGRRVLAPTISHVLDDKVPVVGTVPRDGVTNDRMLTLTGKAEPGTTVTVSYKFNSGSSTTAGTAKLVGSTWRFTTTALPADGRYAFTATNSKGSSSPYAVTLDTGETTAPIITAINDDEGNTSEDVRIKGYSNDTKLDIKGTASSRSLVRIFDGKTLLGATKADLAGNWEFSAGPLADGQTYRFAAQSIDVAGNKSPKSIAIPILIDTTAPWSRITNVNAGKSIADRGVTNQTVLTISGRSEPGTDVDLFDVHNGVTTKLRAGLSLDPSGNWQFTSPSLPQGVHAFYVRATDAAGNTSVTPSVPYVVTIDTTLPLVPTIISAIDSVLPDVGVLASGAATNDTRPLLTGTAPELGTTVRIYDGSTLLGLANVTGTMWAFRPATPLSEGLHILTATATDAAGNESAPSSQFSITIDPWAPFVAGIGTPLPANGTYGLGQPIEIPIQFNQPVFVDPTSGVPQIPLNTVPGANATYTGGSGTNTLVFTYVPQLGQQSKDLDFNSNAIDLNGGTIVDAAGNPLNPTLPTPGSPGSFGALTDIAVNAVLAIDPAAVLPAGVVSGTSPGPTLTGPLPPITITFNGPVTGFTVDSIKLFLEDRSMSTAGVLIEDLGGNAYRLTLPPATHQSLKGRYRLEIGGPGSGIQSGGVAMDTAVSLYWQLT